MWKTLWSYRALWVFGIILALTVSSGGGGGGSGGAQAGGSDWGGQGPGIEALERFWEQLEQAIEGIAPNIEMGDLSFLPGWILALVVGLCCLGVIFAIAAAVARYVAEVALIRMVDDYEATGEKKTVRQGFRLGWSRAAFRIFLIGLVVVVPIVIVAILFFGLAVLPLLAWTFENTAAGVLGTVVTIGLFFLGILALIAIAIVAQVLVRLAWRAAALEDLGVFEALSRGWGLIRSRLGDVALMWLIMLGVNLGYGLLMIPVGIILVIVSLLTGGVVLVLARLVGGLFASGAGPWIVGVLLGLPVFILLMVVPLTFLDGLRRTYESGVWTMTFRELTALDTLDTLVVPSLEEDLEL